MPRNVLVASAVVCSLVGLAHAAPRKTIEHYAVLASEGLRAKGLTVTQGDLGVNLGKLVVSGGLTAPSSQLVADVVRVSSPATCAAVYGDDVRGTAAGCDAAGSDGAALFADPADACGVP